MAEGSNNQSQKVEIVEELIKRWKGGKEKEGEQDCLKLLNTLSPLVEKIEKLKSYSGSTGDANQNPKLKDVPFAIKAANDSKDIENQVIEYIKNNTSNTSKIHHKRNVNLKTNFDWTKKDQTDPLVVFCNYSSRIGVDVRNALRGVEDWELAQGVYCSPVLDSVGKTSGRLQKKFKTELEEQQVILIILHYVRRALLKGDLSDDDELLSDDLKKRAVFITHFAFDDELYDCEQNRQARSRLIRNLKRFFDIDN